jgi:hypothetical protein
LGFLRRKVDVSLSSFPLPQWINNVSIPAGPIYPSYSTLHSTASTYIGAREEPFAIGLPPSGPLTAEALLQEIVDGVMSREFASFLFSIGVNPSVLTVAPITLGIFTLNFPIWGTLVLKAVFAVAISMVCYDEDYPWISTQRPGEIHPLSHYIFLSIQVVLRAHTEDYPFAQPEPGEL